MNKGAKELNIRNPYRKTLKLSPKMIFVACEGQVTEESYFQVIKKLCELSKSKVIVMSVNSDIRKIPKKLRTRDQNKLLSEGQPLQLVDRLDKFRGNPDNISNYEFDKHTDDEFWIVADVDKNWNTKKGRSDISDRDKWNDAIKLCQQKNYRYAVSNPFFEVWLLLHHDDLNDKDKQFAVTDTHEYEKTNHFRERLRNLKVGLKGRNKKEINPSHYTAEKIKDAIRRSEAIHVNKEDLEPKYCCSTVYRLLKEVMELSVVDRQ